MSCISQLLNPTVFLAACGHDAEGLEILCQVFRTYAPSYLADIENVLRKQNGPRLCEVAHKLNGLLVAFSPVATAGRAGEAGGIKVRQRLLPKTALKRMPGTVGRDAKRKRCTH